MSGYQITEEETAHLVTNAPIWDPSTHLASVTISTSTDNQIQWQKGGIAADGWTIVAKGEQSITIPNLSHNDTIYARLWDGTSAKKEATVKVEDGQSPEEATITALTTLAMAGGGRITATVALVDYQSGVKIADCKWKFTTSQTKLGTEATSYTGEMSGSFTNESGDIDCTAILLGTYWLHVLTLDNAGNPRETVSETSVSVEGGFVTNYSSGQDLKWRVFYGDENVIYLITSDVVPVSDLSEQKESLGFLTSSGGYGIW